MKSIADHELQPGIALWWLLSVLVGGMLGGTAHAAGAVSASTGVRRVPEKTLAAGRYTRIADLHTMPAEVAAKAIPVTVKGVLTAFSGFRDWFFLEDGSGGIAVNRNEHTDVTVGDLLEVRGRTVPGRFASSLDTEQVRVIRHGVVGAPRIFPYAELEGGLLDSGLISIRGVVRSARVTTLWDKQVLTLNVAMDGAQVTVLVQHYRGDGARLVDAGVEIKGVCGTIYNGKQQFTGVRLFVDDERDVRVVEAPPSDPFAAPRRAIRNAMQFCSAARTKHRMKIEGVVTMQVPGHFLYVQDGNDGMEVTTTQEQRVAPGTLVEVAGFPTSTGGYSPALRDGTFRVMGTGAAVAPVRLSMGDFVRKADTYEYAPYDSQLVALRGTVLETNVGPKEATWLLRLGDSVFTAVLDVGLGASAGEGIANGSVVSVVGVLTVQVNQEQNATAVRILMRDRGDLVVVKTASWWTPAHAWMVVSSLVLVILGIGLWVAMLRQRVERQTKLLRVSEERFRKQAQTDTLTGLASRSYLQEQMREAIGAARGGGAQVGLLMIDLDHFKEVNDTLGHHVGDDLLRVVAGRLRMSVRKSDLVARMGGDEFVVLLRGMDGEEDLERIGEKVVGSVGAPAEVGGRWMNVSASVGACLYRRGYGDGETLLRYADAALYRAKDAGRNTLRIYRDGMADEAALAVSEALVGS